MQTLNPNRGTVAIETAGYGFTIIELRDSTPVELGDVISWEFNTACGGATYQNETKKLPVLVYVLNHWVPPAQLRQQLLID